MCAARKREGAEGAQPDSSKAEATKKPEASREKESGLDSKERFPERFPERFKGAKEAVDRIKDYGPNKAKWARYDTYDRKILGEYAQEASQSGNSTTAKALRVFIDKK